MNKAKIGGSTNNGGTNASLEDNEIPNQDKLVEALKTHKGSI